MRDAIVIFKDGRKGFVSILDLPISSLFAWIEYFAAGDSPAMVGLCIGRTKEYVDTLSDDSFKELAKIALKSNFDRAMDFAATDLVAGAKVLPMLRQIDRATKKKERSWVNPGSWRWPSAFQTKAQATSKLRKQ